MKITKITHYKKNDKIVFVYAVTGTDEEIALYKSIKGDNYKEDSNTGKPLYWSSQFYQPDTKLVFNFDKTGVYADTSEFDEAAALAKQYGGNLGQSIADISAAKLLRIKTVRTQPAVEDPENESFKPNNGKIEDQ